MSNHKKTMIGSLIALFLGTSCCWISSIAIWLGGVAIIGSIGSFMESTQSLFIALSIILGLVSFYLYQRNRGRQE